MEKMNVLFLSLTKMTSIQERGIYSDLLREFRSHGHHISILSPLERRYNEDVDIIREDGVDIVQVKTLNITKTNVIEKGLSTITIEKLFIKAINNFFYDTKFDLVLHTTPPITFANVVKYVMKRDGAYSYLLLKDIFPQNAVDLGMLSKKGILYKYFRYKEKQLYSCSDMIGCMSPANVAYVLEHNPSVKPEKVEINPNSITPISISITKEEIEKTRRKYGLPIDKTIFVYGGNLGKPQGLPFLLDIIPRIDSDRMHLLIVGDGTEYSAIKKWFDLNRPKQATLLRYLPKQDYDTLLSACDVGLILLNKDFTIPNFPSRLLSYFEMKMPIISATDTSTDVGDVIESAKCGIKVIYGDVENFLNAMDSLSEPTTRDKMGLAARALLEKEYLASNSYDIIIKQLSK